MNVDGLVGFDCKTLVKNKNKDCIKKYEHILQLLVLSDKN